jgi:hypothetical protein
MEEILLKFRQLPRSHHAVRQNHEWCQHLPVAVFCCVKVQHEVDEGPFQSRARPCEKGEPRTGHFRSPGQIDYPEHLPELPVRKGIKAELRLFPPLAYNQVGRFILPDGHALMGHVGQGIQDLVQLLLNLFDPVIV